MKITKAQLKQIIKEEISKVLREDDYDRAEEIYNMHLQANDELGEDMRFEEEENPRWAREIALGHLRSLFRQNPDPSEEEIKDAIREGYSEASGEDFAGK